MTAQICVPISVVSVVVPPPPPPQLHLSMYNYIQHSTHFGNANPQKIGSWRKLVHLRSTNHVNS